MLLQHDTQPKSVENRFKPVRLWFSICFKPVQLLAANCTRRVFFALNSFARWRQQR